MDALERFAELYRQMFLKIVRLNAKHPFFGIVVFVVLGAFILWRSNFAQNKIPNLDNNPVFIESALPDDTGDIACTLLNGVLTISGSGKMGTYAHVDARDGLIVNCPWYPESNTIFSVVIEDGVTSIGVGAFVGCENLTSVIIPDSITSIGEWAFFNCSSLTSVIIPNSVTNIGQWAFYSCDSLTSVSVPAGATIQDDAFPAWTTVTRRT